MKTTLTVTRKGQTTIPIDIRRRLGLGPEGGALVVDFDETKSEISIKRPETLEELSDRLTKLIKPGIKPLQNVSEWVESNRAVDANGFVE